MPAGHTGRDQEVPLAYAHTVGGTRHVFADLRTMLARATPCRSGDALAGLAAERVAAQMALADLPLAAPVVPTKPTKSRA